MAIQQITEGEIALSAVSSLPSRPNAGVAFGGRGMTPRELKAAFDRLPRLAIEKINEILASIEDGTLCRYLNLPDEDECLADFITNVRYTFNDMLEILYHKISYQDVETEVGGDSEMPVSAGGVHRALLSLSEELWASIRALEEGTGVFTNLSLVCDPKTYELHLYRGDGTDLCDPVDLPVESMVIGAEYVDTDRALVLHLQSGESVSVPVAALVAGLVSDTAFQAALATKQNALTFDTAPRAGSTNPVTGGGVHTALTDALAGSSYGAEDGRLHFPVGETDVAGATLPLCDFVKRSEVKGDISDAVLHLYTLLEKTVIVGITVTEPFSVRETANGLSVIDGSSAELLTLNGKSARVGNRLCHTEFSGMQTTNKNLFRLVPSVNQAANTTLEILENEVSFTGTPSKISAEIAYAEDADGGDITALLVDGETYTFSQEPFFTSPQDENYMAWRLTGMKSDGEAVCWESGTTPFTVTVDKSIFQNYYLAVVTGEGCLSDGTPTPYTGDNVAFMCNRGESALDVIEQHSYVTRMVEEPITLPRWDTLDFGAQQVRRASHTIVFTGEEYWWVHTVNSNGVANFMAPEVTVPKPATAGESICSHCDFSNKVGADATRDGYYIDVPHSTLYFRSATYKTAADWKNYLRAQYAAGTPLTITYRLAESLAYSEDVTVKALYPIWQGGDERILPIIDRPQLNPTVRQKVYVKKGDE